MSIADRRAREKEQRRNDIIAIAEKLFFSRGYDNVSIEDIAKEAELNRATIYFYFGSKEALFYAIVLRGVRMLNAWVKEGVKNGRSSLQKINSITMSYVMFLKQHPDYFKAYNYFQSGRFDFSDVEAAGEDLREIVSLQREIYEVTIDAVKSGMDDGTLRSDVSPVDVAVYILSTVENLAKVSPGFKDLLDSQGTWSSVYHMNHLGFMQQLIRKSK